VKQLIAEKMVSLDTSKIEEEAIRDALEEQNFIKGIVVQLQMFEEGASDKGAPRFLAGQFCKNRPPFEVVLPENYLLWDRGLYIITPEQDNPDQYKVLRLSRIPFYIAKKDESGKAMLVRYINGMWLQDWIPVRSLSSKGAYLSNLIMPGKGVKFKALIEYAFECVAIAPFVSTCDPALSFLLQDIQERFYLYPDASYPNLVNVSKIKSMCQDYEVSYENLRRWFIRHGYIRQESHVKRDKETRKPSRFLVFEKALELEETLEETPDEKPGGEEIKAQEHRASS